jgi:tRNA (adenine57-N1/adenine58-N1)-methyltransferase
VAGPFREGEPCLLLDNKGRRYFLTLGAGREFQYHNGTLAHDLVIGASDGSVLASSRGSRLIALRPRLADYVLKMRRGAQVVYPKDTGPILVYADIGPGSTVVEAGTGSGALTMALVRAVGAEGKVVSVERREDHAAHARKQITAFFGVLPPQLELRVGEVEEAIAAMAPDRIVLDLPEPWHAAEVAVDHLQPGGVFCAYLPTVPQIQELCAVLSRTRRFVETTTFEILLREWAVEGRSVRPDHQMIGHTGFITVSRLLASPV